MITVKEPEIPSKKYFNPEKMIQKYNYNNNVLPKEIERNIAHNIALLLNSPIEDFVRYHSLEKDDKWRCANYEWYERQYWLFYVDIDANTRYFFLPTFLKEHDDMYPYLLIRKKVNDSYEHLAIVFYKVKIFRNNLISTLYHKVNGIFKEQDRLKLDAANKKKTEKFV